MEMSTQRENIGGALSSNDIIDYDNTNSNLTNNDSLASTLSFDAKSTIIQKPRCLQDEFNSNADVFDTEDFIGGGSQSSENLEMDKVVHQLEHNLEDDVFTGGSVQNKTLETINESNLSTGDTNLELEELINNQNDDINTCSLGAFSSIGPNKSKEEQIIDIINEELHNTLQFTDVLCHYIYSDVIVGKDFFQLFCDSDNLGSNAVLTDVIKETSD